MRWLHLPLFLLPLLPAGLPAQEKQEPPTDPLGDLIAKAAAWQPGKRREPLADLEARIRRVQGRAAQARALARRLAAALAAEKTTTPGRRFFCRQLALVGGPEQVPTLAALLEKRDLAHMARYALERIPGKEATRALLAGALRSAGRERLGLIHSLGRRGDPATATLLAALVRSPDLATSIAAARALVACDEELAVELLSAGGARAASDRPGEVARAAARHFALSRSLLEAAHTLGRKGKQEVAERIFRRFLAFDHPGPIRREALAGLVTLLGEGALDRVLHTLTEGDLELATAAARLLGRPGIGDAPLAAALPGIEERLTPLRLARLLHALEPRRGKAFLPFFRRCLDREDPRVKRAACAALGRIGGAAEVSRLLPLLGAEKDLGSAAAEALTRLPDPGADPVLLDALAGSPDEKGLLLLVGVIQERRSPGAFARLLPLAAGDSPRLRQKAYAALGELAEAAHLARFTDLLCRVPEKERDKAGRALARAIRRTGRDRGILLLLAYARRGDKEKIPALLPVLPRVGGDLALAALRPWLQAEPAPVREAAFRALCSWPEPAALADLAPWLKKDRELKFRVLAIRGVVRLVGKGRDLPASERFAHLAAALDAATRPEERRKVIAALGEVRHLPALETLHRLRGEEELGSAAAAAIRKLGRDLEKWVPEEKLAAAKKIVTSAAEEQKEKHGE